MTSDHPTVDGRTIQGIAVELDAAAEGLLLTLAEPALLVTGAGVIVRANGAAAALFGAPPASMRGLPITHVLDDAPSHVAAFLDACARTRAPLPGALHPRPAPPVNEGAPPASAERRRVSGAMVRPQSPLSPALLLLRFRSAALEGDRFALLNRQIDELTREIRRRRAAERALGESNARLREQAAELAEANDQLQAQAVELEVANEQLQEQAVELEVALEELRSTAERLEERTVAAEAAERRSRELVESVTDPLVAYDRNWHMVYFNEPAREVLGVDGNTPHPGQLLWDVVPSLQGTELARAMHAAMDGGRATRFEWRGRTGSWVEVRTYPTGDGLLAYWTDVTAARRERERAELLGESSAAFAEALGVDEALRSVLGFCARHFADFCSMSLAESDGTLRLVDVVHRDPERAAVARELELRYPLPPDAPVGAPAVIRSGQSSLQRELSRERILLAARDADHLALLDRLGMVSTIVVPLAARGRTLGALTLVSAESARRYDEQDLALAEEIARRAALVIDNARLFAEAEEARRRAEEANHGKSQFLASMSHELRTPLNAIGGHLALMADGLYGPVGEAQLDALSRVQRAQRHLLGLINDLLNYAKLDAGRVTYDMGSVHARDVLADVMPMIQLLIAGKGHTLEHDLPEDRSEEPVMLWADRERLAQVLINLLSNAVKFTPPGGRIRVVLTTGAAPGVPEGHACLSVSDTGMGIPAEQLSQIFEPFTQVGRALNRPVEGTGLGLAISRDLARGMGGELLAESTPGVGSTFTLVLRVA